MNKNLLPLWKYVLLTKIICLPFGVLLGQESKKMKLWYDKSADGVWERALPIGNGFQAAMVYGNVDTEVIQLNEGTVWSGSPYNNNHPETKDSLESIRDLVFQGKYREADQLSNKVMFNKRSFGQKFQSVGELNLVMQNHNNVSNYYRELDIENAVAKTTYEIDGIIYNREYFASLKDNIIVIKLSANDKGKISFSANYKTEHAKHSISTEGDQLILKGTTSDHEGVPGKVRFTSVAKFFQKGGTKSTADGKLKIEGADEVIIHLAIATNFVNYHDISADENKRAADILANSSSKKYESIRKDHIQAYSDLFNRVKLDLGTTASKEIRSLPTDQRLDNFRNQYDPEFISLYYQFGRYLLISCSQPGGQPATLQGLWNGSLNPAWDSKYTININTEMNYWPAERTNLSELHQPLIQMVKDLAVTGAETAKVMYGARGWMAHHNTDLWRATGPVDGALWGLWNAGGAWLSQHLWEHYLYNGDQQYLDSVYDVLKGAALFYVDFLVEHPEKKWLVVNPGTSPENSPKGHQGTSIDAGTTMDNQIVFDVLTTAINAAKILDRDDLFVDTLMTIRKKLPPMQIGQHGQLQEWLDDLDDPNDKHRHISHLYGLFPSSQISAYRTPELFQAAKTTLLQRGDVSTGWSMGWKVNWWARMQDGDHAYLLIKNQLTPLGVNADGGGTYPNLFDAHPPFQIDGNFGCTSGITEMLVQTADGAIQLLPALPNEWKEGSINGIKAFGGFEIRDLKWEGGKIKEVTIFSNLGGNCRIRTFNQVSTKSKTKVKPTNGDNENQFFAIAPHQEAIISPKAKLEGMSLTKAYEYDLDTKSGKSYKILFN